MEELKEKKEKKVKIIAIAGLSPREFQDTDNNIYIHEEEVKEVVADDGTIVKGTFAVYEIPESLAKFKLSEMPHRYKLYGVSRILRFPSITAMGARSFVTATPVKFQMFTKSVIDPETGEIKTKRGSKEPVVQKYFSLVEKGNKVIDAKPFRTETINEEQ